MSDFATYANVEISKEDSLCNVLFKVIQGITKLSDARVLEFLQVRLGAKDESSSLVEALLEIDDAAAVFERMDLEVLKSEQRAARSEIAAADEYESDYVDARKRHNDAEASKRSRGKKREPFPGRIEQSVAREFIPPGASIWRGNRAEPTWHGHMPPQEEDPGRQFHTGW